MPHYNRDAIAAMLGLAPGGLQLFEGHVGGGFGIRGELYPEDVLVCLAARAWAGRSSGSRTAASIWSRPTIRAIRCTGCARCGRCARGFILGLEDEFWADQGAYVRTHAATVADLAAAMLPGPYVVPAYRAPATSG